MKKNLIIYILTSIILLCLHYALDSLYKHLPISINHVLAEEDEDEDEYETIERVYIDKDVATSTEIIEDKDKDGILDIDDPNPEIAEIFIVKDNNKNGIVDSFENYE